MDNTPIRFDSRKETRDSFKSAHAPERIVDQFDALLEDLFLVRTPAMKFAPDHSQELATFKEEYCKGKTPETLGEWFYFPWNKTLAHYLPEPEHQELRTARNKNIITADEQQRMYGLRVGYAGLSVGSHGVLTFAHMGGGSHIAIADPDEISPSNLNRMRYNFLSVGRKKTDMVREYLYELNPYSVIRAYDEGVTEQNKDDFFGSIDVLVEETDNLGMKVRLREIAREHRIPVIMATDNGDNIIIDVERFDLHPDAPIFHGRLGALTAADIATAPRSDMPKIAGLIAGNELTTKRMLASVQEVGKTLYSWPQLCDAATLAGVSIAYMLKCIATDAPLREGKYEVNLDTLIGSA